MLLINCKLIWQIWMTLNWRQTLTIKCLCVFIFNIQTNTLNSFSKSYSPSTLYFKGRKQNTSMKRSKVSLRISFGRTWILYIVYEIQSQWLLGSKEDFNDLHIWASSWDYGTYHIGDQQRLGQACAFAQSRQSLRCSHTWLMEEDEESNQNQTSSPIGWLRMHIWRMGLQRTKSTIISWDGSFDLQTSWTLWETLTSAASYEPHHEKTCLWGFRPGKTQTGLLSYRD